MPIISRYTAAVLADTLEPTFALDEVLSHSYATSYKKLKGGSSGTEHFIGI